ncbi:MAG: galactose mutarotase [Oscillospiraceae bacterium]|nr:galactose mutarotase [Oscillospiraceae bacterium]
MIEKTPFGAYELYTAEEGDVRLRVTNLGASVVSLRFRGRETVLGYDDPSLYLEKDAYLGAAIGRYANRIGGAAFPLNGVLCRVTPNEGANQLHGGPASYDKRPWRVAAAEDALRFELDSPDGDNGFPGALRAAVTYTLLQDGLRVDYEADCDSDTVYAPTSHLYFDLSGRGSSLDARLRVNADRVVETGEGLIPTGRLLPAEGRFDFRALRVVAEDYDDCFVLNGEDCCTLEDGGLRMDVRTDLPAVQIYTGTFLPAPHAARRGLAIEPEFFPDSPNHPEFPSTLLRAGERFHRWAEFRFREL